MKLLHAHTMQPRDIFKVNNGLVKPLYCILEYIICSVLKEQ